MKLIARPASPFARKCRVLALERDLMGKMEVEILNNDGWQSTIPTYNPLEKVPAMVTDDGTVIYDSPVICEYLDSVNEGAKLFPAPGPERWRVLRLQALGDGIADAIVAFAGESGRPEEKQTEAVIARQRNKIDGGADWLESHIDELDGDLNIGQIAIACAFGYGEFRIPGYGWRDGRAKLTAWFEAFAERPSMKDTFFRRPGS